MPPIVPLHLAHILRPLRTERIVLKLTLHRPPPSIRNIHIPVASIISPRPTNKLIPVPTLASLKGVVTLAERFRREFEPGRIVGVAVDVLQEAVEAVLDVMIEVVLLWGASVGGGGEFLYLDLCSVMRVFFLCSVGGDVGIRDSASDGKHRGYRCLWTGPKGTFGNVAGHSARRIRPTERWFLDLYPELPTARLALPGYPRLGRTRC